MEIKIKLNVKAQINHNKLDPKPITIESGAFADIPHYSGLDTEYLYSILLHGTRDGRIPSRNIIPFLEKYIEDNKQKFVQLYIDNIDISEQAVGHAAGQILNSEHRRLISDFVSPSNAFSTIVKKGFDDPFIWTGSLQSSIFYSINGEGRYI